MQRFSHQIKLAVYFLSGALATIIVLVSLTYLAFSFYFQDKIYPGVQVNGHLLSSLTTDQASKYLSLQTNQLTGLPTNLVFSHPSATISASSTDLKLYPDVNLMAKHAFSIGRQTPNPYHNFLQILAAWQGKINLPLDINLDFQALNSTLDKISPEINIPPVDAVFQFQAGAGADGRGRVIAFTPSRNGREIDRPLLGDQIVSRFKLLPTNNSITFAIPIKVIAPSVKSSTADELGIKNLLGRGESFFYDSIPGRIYNIGLGTQKVNGSLIAPGETFSFDNAIGTISALFGFQKAYAIKEGKTVLDDGGGVCQVSTTLYRAALNAGLPIIERSAHTYRVGFYEQGGFLPGMDATVYPPSPDFKFKNDTGGYLLLQALTDYDHAKLTFEIFGTSDGRKTEINGPYILSTSPPPDPIYEDDVSLPVGQIKQVDTAHYGAKVYFQRTVIRGDQLLIREIVNSDYIPWPARFLKGTKTN